MLALKRMVLMISFWQGNHPKNELDDVSTINPILVGDTIVTGGMSDYFPYGIPIGKVSSLKRPKLEGYYDIDIERLTLPKRVCLCFKE